MSADLIKTKCYKTESPVGEVCIFEDKKAIGANAAKYQGDCDHQDTNLSAKNLKNYELQVTDSQGKEIDRQKIAPLTSLNLLKIKVNGTKTFYLQDSESLICTSQRGDGNFPFWVIDGKINFFKINNKLINFKSSLKSKWAPVSDGFLEAKSELDWKKDEPSWVTIYRRYQFENNKWIVIEKSKKIMTEFETDLDEKDFPERAKK